MTYGVSAHDFHFRCVSSQKHDGQEQVENCKHRMEPQQVVSTIRNDKYKRFIMAGQISYKLLTLTDNSTGYHAYLW